MKIIKNISSVVVGSCSVMCLALIVSALAHAQQSDITAKIELPPLTPQPNTDEGKATRYYDSLLLRNNHYLDYLHVVVEIDLEIDSFTYREPVTLRVANFDRMIKNNCENQQSSPPNKIDTINLMLVESELGACYSSWCMKGVCTMDCRRDIITTYRGSNHAGQLFQFKWSDRMSGKVNNEPLSAFTLTDGDTFTTIFSCSSSLIHKVLANFLTRFLGEKSPCPDRQKIAAHFCA